MNSGSPNTVTTIGNIKGILKFRLLFGYYYDSGASIKIRLISKLYCLLVVATLMYYLCNEAKETSVLGTAIFAIECLTYYSVSMCLGESYIIQYYRYVPIIDSWPCARKLYTTLEKILVVILAFQLIARVILHFVFCYTHQNICSATSLIGLALSLAIYYAADLGRFVISAIFMLLFYRVKVMRNMLMTYGFDHSPQQRLTPRKYVQIYQAIVNTFKAIDNPLQYLILVTLVGCMPRTFVHMFNTILNLKENGPSMSDLMRVLDIVQPLITMVIVAVVVDLTSENVNEMLCFTVAETTRCENERERYEMQLLASLLRDGSLRYSVFSVVPLGVSQLLGFFSFCATTIIGILQIKKF